MKSQRIKKVVISLVFGVICAIVNLLLNFTSWFHEDGYSWWRPIALGGIMAVLNYFVLIPLADKEKKKR